MKTSTLLLLGGAAVVGYLYAKRKSEAQATQSAQALSAQAAQVPGATVNVIVDRDDDYGPGWAWGPSVFGRGGFRGGHGHGGGHHGGGGHGHGGRH